MVLQKETSKRTLAELAVRMIPHTREGVLVIVFGMALLAQAGNVYWDPNGSGSWADGTRWEGGVAPTSSDTVRLYSSGGAPVYATVTDDDWPTFSAYNEIVLNNSSTLTLDMTQDVSFNGVIAGSDGTGKLIKKGTNKFVFGNSGRAQFQLKGEIIVSNGWLTAGITRWQEQALFRVFAPGVLETTPVTDMCLLGLTGDGVVTNGNNRQLVFVTNALMNTRTNLKPPYDFSGTFKGKIGLTAGGSLSGAPSYYGTAGQRFIGMTSADVQGVLRVESGLIGIASIGNQGGTGMSSIGNYDDINYFNRYAYAGNEVGIRYLGTGGTTTRKFQLYYNSKKGVDFLFDAGESGGLTFTGNWINRLDQASSLPATASAKFILDGSNTTACVLANAITANSGINRLVFMKRGTGTWRFSVASNRQNAGPILVEEGALEFDSLAEAGAACALGYASHPYTNFMWEAACEPVQFAYRLGNGATTVVPTTGTMKYIGSSAAACATRPFAVNGAGRVSNSGTGRLRLCGAFSDAPGVNSLVLGGTGDDNCFSDVTNGVGTLKVVKEDSGTWQLSGNVQLGGGVEVRAGTLRISNRFSWYRLNLKEAWGTSTFQFGFRLFGLWDDDGNLLSKDLTLHDLRNTIAALPRAGTTLACTNEVSYPNSSRNWSATGALCYTKTDGVIANEVSPAAGNLFRVKMTASTTGNQYPKENEPDTWLRYVIRLPEGANPASCYDFRCEEASNLSNSGMEMKSFGMDGSPDGVHWTEISSTGTVSKTWGSSGYWYSTKGSSRTRNDGFRLSATRDATREIADIPQIAVAADAVLDVEPEAGVTVSGITYDVALGGGTVKGVTFAASGTVEVKGNVSTSETTPLPMTFENVTDLANVSRWSPSVNGVAKPRMRIKATATGLMLCPQGTMLLFR